MDMGHFFFTQSNPTHQLTDPTQPIVPANDPSTPPLNSQPNQSIGVNSGVAQYVVLF